MNDPSPNSPNTPCIDVPDTINIFRALEYSSNIQIVNDGVEIKRSAFYRKSKDNDGLSVQREDRCYPHEVEARCGFNNSIFGVARLPVQCVTTIEGYDANSENLSVRQTSDEHAQQSSHAAICGVPMKSNPGEPSEEVTWYADKLLGCAAVVPENEWKPSV